MAKVTGFFTTEQLNVVSTDGVIGECQECGLYKSCKSPRMGVVGQGKKGILVVGGYPSQAEDSSGIVMSGDSGNEFKSRLRAKGIDLENDCWRINAVACNPGVGKNGKAAEVTRKHIKSCRPNLMKLIADLKPKHVWLMGDDAITSYFIGREKNLTATRWRALCIPDPERKLWIVPMYSPVDLSHNIKDEHFKMIYERDLSFAIRCSKFENPPETPILNKCVTILKTYDSVIKEIKKILEVVPPKLAHDYETTGKKPYRAGHKIASMSWCYDYNQAFSCPYEYRKHFTVEQLRDIGDLWIEVLTHPNIKKIAQNSKFEDMWAREIFGVEPNMWWCTMNTSHILDNRKDFTSLDFQALIRWGIPEYSSGMDKYKRSTSKDNPFNRIMDAPLNDLLLYGGIDSLLTFRLQEEQEEELIPFPKMEAARKFFMDGLYTLCDIQENGIAMDTQYYVKQNEDLKKRIEQMKIDLYKFPEAIQFEQVKKKPLNFGSSHDLAELFFNILKLPKGKQTDGGNDCTDAAVLATLNTPIAKELTKIAKLKKIQSTYMGQFLREIEDFQKMHPFFDLHVPRTFRGSSSDPNFQNIPIRDEEAKIITRSGIMPSKIQELLGQSFINPYTNVLEEYIGNKLADFDYGAMEVRIIACYTQDRRLMSYIFDTKTDMHRDQAIELFKFEGMWQEIPNKLGKLLRFESKNGFVFPEFYGSYYGSCARGLFAKCMEMICHNGITVFEHLQAVGVIRNRSRAYEEFEAHVKKVEERFWHKFKDVKKWQEKAWKDYLQNGYIEQMFGFRCGGWLSKNDVVNYPIQGTAFHCLMWTINHINKRMKELQMWSRMNGQIHDCCLTDLFPPEQKKLMEESTQIATIDIREELKWLNVPLIIEWEETEINKPWGSKIEIRED